MVRRDAGGSERGRRQLTLCVGDYHVNGEVIMSKLQLEQYDAEEGQCDGDDSTDDGQSSKSSGILRPPTVDRGRQRQGTAIEVSRRRPGKRPASVLILTKRKLAMLLL